MVKVKVGVKGQTGRSIIKYVIKKCIMAGTLSPKFVGAYATQMWRALYVLGKTKAADGLIYKKRTK